tara:strand:+ start:29 stop:2941 length:2913 start_codon:yes stop_codon:yes gene_type:complete
MASGARRFKFISPGVYINEIDRSQLPAEPTAMGPVIIGRTERGPGMVPTKVSSFEEFTRVFGAPVPGADGGDNWREGDFDGPTYGAYAAQAWLKSGEAPVTMIRLLGAQHEDNDGTSAALAGWKPTGAPTAHMIDNGGAYGLFLADDAAVTTGSLAAVWYTNQGTSIRLSGAYQAADVTGRAEGAGTGKAFQSNGAHAEFIAEIFTDGTVTGFGDLKEKICFNFNPDSEKFIRKVFNTNPSQTNSSVVSTSNNPNYYTYWLGPTFEGFLRDGFTGTAQVTGSTSVSSEAGSVNGVLLGLVSGTVEYYDNNRGFQNAESPYFRSQDTGDATSFDMSRTSNLFKLVALEYGEWANRNIKVSIENLRAADYPDVDPYGSFSVVLRSVKDRDEEVRVLERFDNLNLNPNSVNYIGRRIGDSFLQWSDSDRRMRQYGDYPNNSSYVRVVIDDAVADGAINPELIPFGYLGPPRFNGFTAKSGSALPVQLANEGNDILTVVKGGADIAFSGSQDAANLVGGVSAAQKIGFVFPSMRVRVSASDGGLNDPTDAYFGIQTTRDKDSNRFDFSYIDLTRPLTPDVNTFTVGARTESSFIFTMDDIVSGTTGFHYDSGSRARGDSLSAQSGKTYKDLLDAGYDRYTAPMHGGFDGLDITEKEPFRNTGLADKTQETSYAFNTIQRAIDTVADPEFVETNIMTAPGITNSVLTKRLIDTCENRGDAIAIIDLENDFVPFTENTSDLTARLPSVSSAITSLKSRSINSSYGCCFFPFVQIRDTGTGRLINVPPSVPALGTFGSSQARTEVWFAPAGFVRGGLSNGAAGIPVTNVKLRLTSKDRDNLYAVNINPIASFPSEGIVIFGQKTLQVQRSALDRINVRRLLIFLKKEVSRIANGILFEPNVQATWDRFTAAVNPFLGDVKARFGLTDFRVVLDNTTTTDDLIDRNILYAKIYLKPARAIEFIALDFIITRTGASFDD